MLSSNVLPVCLPVTTGSHPPCTCPQYVQGLGPDKGMLATVKTEGNGTVITNITDLVYRAHKLGLQVGGAKRSLSNMHSYK